MIKNKIKSVVFDLDGTLVDTIKDIATSMNTVLEINGYPKRNIKEFRAWIGGGVKKMVAKASPADAPNEKLFNEFNDHYKELLTVSSRVYQGIPALIKNLQQLGIQLSILSNKNHEMTKEIVRRLFPSDTFAVVYGLKKQEKAKPDPGSFLSICQKLKVAPEESVMIGDTEIDIQTAHNAGSFSIGVAWGYQNRECLIKKSCHFLAEHPDEIYNYIALQ